MDGCVDEWLAKLRNKVVSTTGRSVSNEAIAIIISEYEELKHASDCGAGNEETDCPFL
jgi:hypothetical protein